MGKTSLESSTAVSNWIYLGLPIFVISAILLNNVNTCGSTEFCTVTLFSILFLATGFSILLLAGLSGGGISNIGSRGHIGEFMFQGLNFSKAIWIIAGIITVVGLSFAVTFWDFAYAPFVGIFLSGLIISIAFLQTNSMLVPITIHGVYNAIVEYLRQGGIDAIINVAPEIGVSLGQSTDFFFNMMLHLTLVSPSEEFYRIWLIIWITIILKGKLNTAKQGYGLPIYIGVMVATASWTILHLVQFA